MRVFLCLKIYIFPPIFHNKVENYYNHIRNYNHTMTKLFQISFFICLISIEYLATTTISISIVENTWDKANHFFAFFVLYI